MKIINLTQHDASPEQIMAGVVELPERTWEIVRRALTFDTLPTANEIMGRALTIAGIVEHKEGIDAAMIGGAPFLMPQLETELRHIGITPLYAFSQREAVEENGVKKSVFRHLGFVEGISQR